MIRSDSEKERFIADHFTGSELYCRLSDLTPDARARADRLFMQKFGLTLT